MPMAGSRECPSSGDPLEKIVAIQQRLAPLIGVPKLGLVQI
jgi:hypothetical protein